MAIHKFTAHHSSNIHGAEYNEDPKTLTVHFKNKAGEHASTFTYPEFSIIDWRRFQDAPSKGAHFAAHIRPHFKGTKTWSK